MSAPERVPTGELVERARATAGNRQGQLAELLTALADRLEELTKVQDPCPECGGNMIPLQKGSAMWSCKNFHRQERRPEQIAADAVEGR